MPEMQPLKEQDKLTWDQVYQCDFLRIPGLTAEPEGGARVPSGLLRAMAVCWK